MEIKTKRRLVFLPALTVLLVIEITSVNAVESFSFVTICDPRPSNFWYPAGRDALTEDLNQIPIQLPDGWPFPEFVFYIGDIDLPSVTEEAYLNSVGEVAELCHVFILGNHEIFPTYCIQEVTGHYPVMLASLPVGASVTMNSPGDTNDTMFMIEYRNVAFITLDIYYDESQETWVDTGVLYDRVMQFAGDALAATNKPVKFVFYHESCYPQVRHVGDALDADPARRDEFWDLLRVHSVTATYAGHDHWSDMDKEVQGIFEINAGVCGLMAGRNDNEPVPTVMYTLVTPGGLCLYHRAQPASDRDWSGAINPVYRFWSSINSRHFYTISESEKNKIINIYAHVWTYEGIAYYAFEDSRAGLKPIYRFWSDTLTTHFYTISESEKQKIIDNYSGVWTFEDIAFYAYLEGQQPQDAKPVYRFWSDSLGIHFYTMNETEKNKIIDNYSDVWTYEGTAWYAY